ncbi:MAG: leucyl/phenylalanyl-tRNA--protein transferase [Deltaproteobacteria bacterium]|nr:leucyl/phenylalanyl-tRNA--protein transferase [Deltaproteobacteria bacterium]
MITYFPPVEEAQPDGLLAIGGDLEVPSLKLAYESGIFPWPIENYPLLWFSPAQRAILEFNDLHIPRRLNQELRKKKFHFKIDQNFAEVIRHCAQGKMRQSSGTWITMQMIEAYLEFHQAGYAHSFECYNQNNQLVGGMYGVGIGKMFAGESMFFLESGASKATLLYACDFLKQHHATWMDIQTLSPLLQQFGAKEIPRTQFLKKLKQAISEMNIFSINKNYSLRSI